MRDQKAIGLFLGAQVRSASAQACAVALVGSLALLCAPREARAQPAPALRVIPQQGHPPHGGYHDAPRVAWSPDGAQIASARGGPLVKIWDAATGMLVHDLGDGHLGIIERMTWSPDGRFLVVDSNDANRSVSVVWDVASGERVADLSGMMLVLEGYAWDVARGRLGVRSARTPAAWSLRTSKLLFDHEGGTYGWPPKEPETPAEAMAWAPDGGALVVARGGVLTAHHSGTGAPRAALRVAAAPLRALAWSASGAWFAALAEDDTLVFGASSLKAAALKPALPRVVDFAWAPDGARFAWTRHDDGADPRRALGVGEAPGAAHIKSEVALGEGERLRGWTPDGTRLITVSPEAPPRVWEAGTGKLAYTVALPPGSPNAGVTLDPTGTRMLTHASDGALEMWNARTGARMHTMPGPEVAPGPLLWSPDGARALVHLLGGPVMVWAPGARSFVVLEDAGGVVEALAWAPSSARVGARVALKAGGAPVARLWDASTGALVRPQPQGAPPWLKPDEGLAVCVPLAGGCPEPAGRREVSLEGDRLVIATPDDAAAPVVRLPPGPVGELDRVVWAPDGRTILHERCMDPDDPPVACGASALTLIDAASGQRLRTLSGTVMGWSPDARLLLVRPPMDDPYRRRDVMAVLWDLKRGRRLRRLPVSHDAVASWSPDGRRLSVAQDSLVRVWRLDRSPSSPALSVAFDARGRWCAVTDDGGFAASPGAEALLGAARDDGQVVALDAHPRAKRALDAVAALVAGASP